MDIGRINQGERCNLTIIYGTCFRLKHKHTFTQITGIRYFFILCICVSNPKLPVINWFLTKNLAVAWFERSSIINCQQAMICEDKYWSENKNKPANIVDLDGMTCPSLTWLWGVSRKPWQWWLSKFLDKHGWRWCVWCGCSAVNSCYGTKEEGEMKFKNNLLRSSVQGTNSSAFVVCFFMMSNIGGTA